MFKNYLKIAIRNIMRDRLYSGINILGLAIGLACFMLIAMWVRDELSYDRGFPNADRVYRIANALYTEGVPTQMAGADGRLAKYVRDSFPGVEYIVRALDVPTLLNYKDRNVFDEGALYVDTGFFNVFAFTFIKGSAKTTNNTIGSVVLNDVTAVKLFGTEDPIGKTLLLNNIKTGEERIPRIVTGVVKEYGRNSHFHPSIFLTRVKYLESFEQTYALFKKGYTPKQFETEIWNPIYNKYYKKEFHRDGQDLSLLITPLKDIHLSSNVWGDFEKNGNSTTVYIFSVVGLLILIVASINYMNLATARSANRAREVGVRKLLGASQQQIVSQFLVESVVVTLCAALLSLAFVEMVLPTFNDLAGKALTLSVLSGKTIAYVVTVVLVVGIASGMYPAFYISSFAPVNAMKGTVDMARKVTWRKSLMVLQFSLSVVMLIATMVVGRQLDYVRKQNLGFEKDQVLVVRIDDPAGKKRIGEMKSELLKSPSITKAAGSYNIPGGEINHSYLKFETNGTMKARLINSMFVNYDYPDLLGLKFTDGQDFDTSMPPMLDSSIFIVVNESALKMLGWDHGAGKKVESGHTYGFRRGHCIGVVKDFHAASLHEPVQPMYLGLSRKANFLSIKVKVNDLAHTIDYISKVYRAFNTGYPFVYNFLDKSFDKQYEKDERQRILFTWFAALCIFISCLGLIGLVSFSTRQRTREISIRKISGASVASIIALITKDFIRLVLIAIAIAIPVGYYVMSKWLRNFAYHIGVEYMVFVIAALTTLIIVLITISIHTIRAANKDPAKVLNYE